MRFIFIGVFLLLPVLLAADSNLQFTSELYLSNTGHHTLEWKNKDLRSLSLYQDNKIIYQGSQTTFFVSGLKNGEYVFLLKDKAKELDRFRLTVKHHSLPLSLTLFLLGFIVFIAISYVILKGQDDD